MPKKIYLASPHMSDEGYEMQYIKEAFDTNWIAPLGKNVDEFENEFARKIGIQYAAALSSGTAAIHLALKSMGVTEGDAVFCQNLTFSASANPIMYLNAAPIFIDSDIETWNMDPNALEIAFKKYKPKAVIIVHLYGLSANLDKLLEICQRYNTPVIEDAAESLGTLYKGRHTGTFGDFGVFSFNGNKIITTSGGGMLVANNKNKIDKIRFWATQSRDKAKYYQHSEIGFNYRLSNVLAGIGRGQLKVLDQRVKRKQEIYYFYKEHLETLENLKMMPDNTWNKPNFWLSCLTVKGKIKPNNIIEALGKENIESRHIWKPMHMQPYYKGFDFIGNNTSEKIFKSGVCLPSDTKMTNEQLGRIVKIIKRLWN